MSQIEFTETHEWLHIENNGTDIIGITDYTQNVLSHLVFIGLPEIGQDEGSTIEADDQFLASLDA
jgi:glycine cleavage system H protein